MGAVWTLATGPDRHRRVEAAIENYRRVPQSATAIVVDPDTTGDDFGAIWLDQARTGVSAEYVVATDPSEEVMEWLVRASEVATAILISLPGTAFEQAKADLERRISAVVREHPHLYRYTVQPLGPDNIHRYPFGKSA